MIEFFLKAFGFAQLELRPRHFGFDGVAEHGGFVRVVGDEDGLKLGVLRLVKIVKFHEFGGEAMAGAAPRGGVVEEVVFAWFDKAIELFEAFAAENHEIFLESFVVHAGDFGGLSGGVFPVVESGCVSCREIGAFDFDDEAVGGFKVPDFHAIFLADLLEVELGGFACLIRPDAKFCVEQWREEEEGSEDGFHHLEVLDG